MPKNIILFIILLTISLIEIFYILYFWRGARRRVKTIFVSALFLLWFWPIVILFFNLIVWEESSLLLEINLAAIALAAPLFGILTHYLIEKRKTLPYFQSYNSNDVIIRISNILKVEKMDLRQVVSAIIKVLHDVFLPKRILLFLVEKDGQCMVPYQQIGLDLDERKKNKISDIGKFCAKSRFFNYIKKRRSIIDIDNLKQSCFHDSKEDCKMVAELKKYSVSLVVPVRGSQDLVGCLFLDYKKSKKGYNPRDFNLLEILASQIASHLENSRLYTELREFNFVLQKKVKKATGELQETNKKLRETIDAKNEFISIVAHQLRAPLAVIKGYLSMMHEGTLGKLSEKQENAVIKIYRGNDDLIDMVENLLNFSRIKDGRIRYNFKQIHLEEVFENVLEQFEMQIKGKQLEINMKTKPKRLPAVKGDFNKLKSVIANFLDNAIKYTDYKDKIDVNITATNQDIVFEMTDNGIGMVPSDAKHLFEKFFRNKDMSFKRIQGTGLGLYIVHRFITAHKGKVWANSPGRSKGSTFGFSLPR
jgi:signal transduction histidine kinase